MWWLIGAWLYNKKLLLENFTTHVGILSNKERTWTWEPSGNLSNFHPVLFMTAWWLGTSSSIIKWTRAQLLSQPQLNKLECNCVPPAWCCLYTLEKLLRTQQKSKQSNLVYFFLVVSPTMLNRDSKFVCIELQTYSQESGYIEALFFLLVVFFFYKERLDPVVDDYMRT